MRVESNEHTSCAPHVLHTGRKIDDNNVILAKKGSGFRSLKSGSASGFQTYALYYSTVEKYTCAHTHIHKHTRTPQHAHLAHPYVHFNGFDERFGYLVHTKSRAHVLARTHPCKPPWWLLVSVVLAKFAANASAMGVMPFRMLGQ